jgi:hypothetical protein
MQHAPHSPEGRGSRPIPRLRKITARLRPEHADEFAGIARGAGVDVEELAGQVLVDYLHRQRQLRRDAGESGR